MLLRRTRLPNGTLFTGSLFSFLASAPLGRIRRIASTCIVAFCLSSFSLAAQAGWSIITALGCFETKQEALNAYFVYDNPDAHTLYPDTICYKDSYTYHDTYADMYGHCTNRTTGGSTYFSWQVSYSACTNLVEPPKNPCNSPVGNPCSAAIGSKHQVEMDYAGNPPALPKVLRHYDSGGFMELASLGKYWRASFDRRISVNGNVAAAYRSDGTIYYFTSSSGSWLSDADVSDRLSQTSTGWTYSLSDGNVEIYDSQGRLLTETDTVGRTTSYSYNALGKLSTITGPFGHTLTLGYDTSGRLATLTDPVGAPYTYSYDANNNLVRVTYPDNTAKVYHYEKSGFPNHLTGISYVDAAGVATRYSTFNYHADGKAALTEHATTTNGAGQESFTLAYNSGTQTTVTDPIGVQDLYTFASNLGVKNLISKINLGDNKTLTQTFDANNNLTCKKDEEGHVNTYTYNATNQKVSETTALLGDCATPSSTPETRTTTYQYVAPDLDLPTLIESPSVYGTSKKATEITYDANRNPRVITQRGYAPDGTAVSRTVTMTYNTLGQVKSIDGPRTDVTDITTFDYYDCTTGAECGQLLRVTNALGQATTYDSYDANGRVKQTTDPNGLKTAYTYDQRGRVRLITITAPDGAGARLTQYTYDPAGNVTQVITPDGITLTYVYDAALDLRSVTDNLGNKVEYTYDRKGNRATEKTYDPNGTLVRSMETAYDARNRVASVNAGGSIATQVHDAIGNLTEETDPNNQGKTNPAVTSHGYDASNRLLQTVDRLAGVTTYDYDVNDRLQEVRAPNAATTQYTYDDLGNVLREQSPDRGTLTYIYDAAGNVRAVTDARAVTAAYAYDALNRLTAIDYPGTTEDVTYTYDSAPGCAFGLGRLCTVQDESGTTTYAYDAFGNLAEQKKTELGITYTTRYTHDAGNRLTGITYPDGRVLTYTRDAIGRIQSASLTINGVVTSLVTNRTYRADGLLTAQIFGNGLTEARSGYDLQGRLGQQSLGTLDTRTYGYDPNGNLIAHPTLGVLNYDALDRLREEPGTVYAYDANGNRQTAGAVPYTYASASNRLITLDGLSLNRDAAGNLIADANFTYTYNQANRLATVNGKDRKGNPVLLASYTYNAQGQRTRKTTPTATTVYHYDTQGNLLAETTDTGTGQRAYAYLDTVPVAQIDRVKSGGTTTDVPTYLYTDHLGTPRLGTNSQGTLVWRNDGDAFGTTLPNQDPDQNNTLTTVNLRFPGQYYDPESGLHYNWNRYYDPHTGRYITSDPIGLAGGLNTYLYARANPHFWTDRRGLVLDTWEGPGDQGMGAPQITPAFVSGVISGGISGAGSGGLAGGLPGAVAGGVMGVIGGGIGASLGGGAIGGAVGGSIAGTAGGLSGIVGDGIGGTVAGSAGQGMSGIAGGTISGALGGGVGGAISGGMTGGVGGAAIGGVMGAAGGAAGGAWGGIAGAAAELNCK